MTTARKGWAQRQAARFVGAIASAFFVAIFAVLVAPCAAWARDYSISKVDIDATLSSDGTLTVVEERTFSFDGSFNGVYWNIPVENADGSSIDVTPISAGYYAAGTLTEIEADSSGANNSLSVRYVTSDSGTMCLQFKIFHAVYDEDVTYQIVYQVENAATSWADCGELYWKFVSDGWDVPSENVTLALHLPVPNGETIKAGDNVLMWAHGPLDGEVSAQDYDIVATVPEVGTSSFAEIRVTFPNTWLSGVASSSTEKLDEIKAEEQEWAEEADHQRMLARIRLAAGAAIPTVLAVLTVLKALKVRRAYRDAHTPTFQGEYFRDVPSDDHPAVLGALYERGKAEPDHLRAALMRLTDEHVVELERITTTKHGLLGDKEQTDYRLTYNPERAAEVCDKVDQATADLFFEKIWKQTSEDSDASARPTLMFSDLDAVAKKKPEHYVNIMKAWNNTVERACSNRGFFADKKNASTLSLTLLKVACVAVGALGIFFAILAEAWILLLFALIALAGVAFAQIITYNLDDLSPEAVELIAKLRALRKWLQEFTALDEAVPTDVVLWNRLLVMAVALGVADEVIKQLEVALPQILEDETFMTTYIWFYSYGGTSPISAFDHHYGKADNISTAALAASSSSSSGGGGGFSGGGGGGFGGGGGGGAF